MTRYLWAAALLWVAALLLGTTAACQAAPAPVAYDLNGILRQPLAANGAKGIVLVFVANDCPISNSYAPEISRLAAHFSAEHINFFLVNTDTNTSAAAVRAHGQQYKLTVPTLLDPKHTLARFAGATATPEAVAYAPSGTLVYRGRIDNKYVDFGKVRPQATTHDLRAALDAFLAHRPISPRETKAVGCYI